ncbi:MAG: nucleotidyltransferase domain-containing protein [Bacteroidales bacterium]|nr:nucleotidyltransferase domain-containing protein [Bacteroidales bacterium]
MDLFEKNIEYLTKLCIKYRVLKLYVFGSAISDKFRKDSDIDLLVTFDSVALNDYADNYFDFKFSLEDLFKRRIDLLEEKAIRNPFLKQSIDNSKELIYG